MEEFYQLMIGHSIFNRFIVTSCFIVKMRPFFKEFIQAAVNYYEIYVYTKGTRNYAQEICDAIRNQYADKEQ
jgi:TFIIF-interacting CTD phosphatase-like protein